jgi:hypothetical protein
MSSGLKGQAPSGTAAHSTHLIRKSEHTFSNELSYLQRVTQFLHARPFPNATSLIEVQQQKTIWNTQTATEVNNEGMTVIIHE